VVIVTSFSTVELDLQVPRHRRNLAFSSQPPTRHSRPGQLLPTVCDVPNGVILELYIIELGTSEGSQRVGATVLNQNIEFSIALVGPPDVSPFYHRCGRADHLDNSQLFHSALLQSRVNRLEILVGSKDKRLVMNSRLAC
jgi:hypothetical protein